MTVKRDVEKKKDSVETPGGHSAYLEGGWGWVVAFGSCGTHFMVPAMSRSFGLIYLVMLDLFQESAAKTGFVVALFNTIRMGLGPFAGFLVDRFSCRAVVIVGGLILSAGILISAFATSLLYMFISFSVITGIGASLVFTPSYIIVGQYFNKRKGKAMGIATMGSGLGSVAMAPIIALLLKHYSFFGTMLILSAIQLHNCVFGALFRPPPEHKSEHIIGKVDENLDHDENEDGSEDLKAMNSDCEENKDTQTISVNGNTEDTQTISVNGNTNSAIDGTNEDENKKSRIQRILTPFAIMTNRTFLLYGLQIIAFSACMSLYVLFLPGIVQDHGASVENASLLLSIFGIADSCSRFFCGFVLDLKPIRYRRRVFHALLGVLLGGATVLTALMFNYVTFAVTVVLFGIFEGGFHSQRATIVSEFVAKEQMSVTVGFVIFFQGVGNLLGPPVGGAMRDYSGRYEDGYFFVGTAVMVTSLLFIVDYFWVLYRRPAAKKSDVHL